ncbi:SAM-dependent methyltransferase [Azonexus hydrophilus]|uniref:Chemotaxis protein methyltransferase n=1 Tax=Azonexus hydrophilus TaxID=418702 RepID=A0A1R1I2S0_9RHOO|nr:protein-glutamate O-methyltransferase CheR [Azonexus hydrophilus]OMG52987.1 SAM-dependent methyltransferase [Azonexus hydrophilus]
MSESAISDQEFALFQRLIYKIAGINLSDAKKVLLVGRLQKRLRFHGLDSYARYYRLLASGEHPEELQIMVDLLTTNETYFFREPKHFEFLRDEVLPARRGGAPFRVWSAASSTGEEAYTLAMLLSECLPGSPWEIVGSDISTQVLEKARRGHYPIERNEGIPQKLLVKYCRKGVRSQAGTFLINSELRERVSFHHINLTLPIEADIGKFDVIFLRNVMIYFDIDTKRKVVEHLLPRLHPGGHFIIGHSETLNGISAGLRQIRPTIYQKD